MELLGRRVVLAPRTSRAVIVFALLSGLPLNANTLKQSGWKAVLCSSLETLSAHQGEHEEIGTVFQWTQGCVALKQMLP